MIDQGLSWSCQVSHVIRKISKFIPILYHVRNSLTSSALRYIYNSIIYPNLHYCCSVWGGCTAYNMNPLLILQKRLVRIMCHKTRLTHTAPLFKSLSVLTVAKIHSYMCLLFVFKMLQNDSDWFVIHSNSFNTRLSNQSFLTLPPIYSTHSRRSIRWVGPKLWNSLPNNLRSITNYNSFKFHVKRYLLAN